MTPIEVISITLLIGLYLAPVAFISARYGTGIGIASGLIWVAVGVFALSVYGGGVYCMSADSLDVLKSAARWYNARVMSNVAESEEINKYLNP